MKKRFFLIILSFISLNAYSDNSEILERINHSQQLLEKENARITREKIEYSKRIDQLVNKLKELKTEADNIQRIEDEKSIGLESLKTRLERWEDQISYQEYIFDNFSDFLNANQTESDDILTYSLEELQRLIIPQWNLSEIAQKNGEILDSQTIKLGPINVFYNQNMNVAGLFDRTAGQQNETIYEYASKQTKEIVDLHTRGIGFITFDATQGKAFELLKSNESLIAHINKGGVWVIPIIIFGMLSILLTLFKLKQVASIPRYTESLVESLNKIVKNTQINQTNAIATILDKKHDPLRDLAIAVVSESDEDKREASLISILGMHKYNTEKHLDSISMVAAVAPLLGLLGTVSGMIETFKMLTIFGSGDPAAISGGISEALVTTELGLVVAIPSLIVNALLSRKVKSHLDELERYAIQLNASRS